MEELKLNKKELLMSGVAEWTHTLITLNRVFGAKLLYFFFFFVRAPIFN